MPSRKELREILTTITHESFSSSVPLDKTSYKDAEANQIQLQALISYHGLMFVDEILCKFNSYKTNFSTELIRIALRSLYKDNDIYRTCTNKDIAIQINDLIDNKTSIGRNQAIELLLTATKRIVC